MRCLAPRGESATSRPGRRLDGRICQHPNLMPAPDQVRGQTQRRRNGPARVNHGQQEPAAPVSTDHALVPLSDGDATARRVTIRQLHSDGVSERHTALPAVCRSSRRDASVDQAQDRWSNDTVTVPLAFRVAWALSWNCRCEPSEPVALTLKVECSTPLRRLFSSPNQFTKCPV